MKRYLYKGLLGILLWAGLGFAVLASSDFDGAFMYEERIINPMCFDEVLGVHEDTGQKVIDLKACSLKAPKSAAQEYI